MHDGRARKPGFVTNQFQHYLDNQRGSTLNSTMPSELSVTQTNSIYEDSRSSEISGIHYAM